MIWDEEQRSQRSLEGGRNNKAPDAPKKEKATPAKVDTIIGKTFGVDMAPT